MTKAFTTRIAAQTRKHREVRLKELRVILKRADHYERAANATLLNRPLNWKLLIEECRLRAAEANALARWHIKKYSL
jgi:hypothetical protein